MCACKVSEPYLDQFLTIAFTEFPDFPLWNILLFSQKNENKLSSSIHGQRVQCCSVDPVHQVLLVVLPAQETHS